MKKKLCLLLALLFALSLCSCAAKDDSPSGATEPSGESAQNPENAGDSDANDIDISSIGGVDVDSGLFNVTITVPSDFLDEGITQEQLNKEAEESGFKSITLNDDGSATYVMTKAQHQEMMQEIKESIDSSLSEIADSADYPSIVKIEANNDYTQYKVFLNTEEVGLTESFVVIGFYMFSGMYHIFNGTEPGNVNVQYISETTGQVIQEANSSDIG